jgi:hypothetical protein
VDLSSVESESSSINHIKPNDKEKVVEIHDKSANKPPSSKAWLGMMVIISLGIAILSIASELVTYQQERRAAETQQVYYQYLTATKQEQHEHATSTKQTQNKQATTTKLVQTKNMTATAESAISLVPKDISVKFPVIHYFDTFENNTSWITGNFEGNQVEIRTNNLVVNHVNANSLVFEEIPKSNLRNFYFQADALLVTGAAESSCYGIAYRRQTSSNSMYIFYICDTKMYNVYFWSESSGYEFIVPDWTFNNSIHPGEANQLGVIADGQNVELFINGDSIYSYTDKKTSGAGTISLTTALFDNKKASFVFDNLVLLTK